MSNNELKWYFPDARNTSERGENDGPRELFSSDTYQSLIRESIQNSLDHPNPQNSIEKKPVRVEYKLRKYSTSSYLFFYDGLLPHIQSCYNITKADRFRRMLEVTKANYFYILEVSDYNTIGMDYSYDTSSGRFQKFVRSIGSPNNNNGAGGSHGYGKTTYFSTSEINTIIVSSMTIDGTCTFEGVSRLATHPTERPHYTYLETGFWDKGDGVPIQNHKGDVVTFIPDFFQRHEPGTTVYIPFAEIDDSRNDKRQIFKKCCESVLRNFFAAINDGMLEVVIDFSEHGEDLRFECNNDTIGNIFKTKFFNDPPYDKAKRNLFESFNPYPYWLAYVEKGITIDESISPKEAEEKCIGEKYIRFNKSLPILGHTSLFLNIDLQRGNDVIVFMRRPRMVVKVQRNGNYSRGYSAVFLCDDDEDGKGNQLLRYMEDAAHKTWSRNQLRHDKRPQEMIDKADLIEEEMTTFINNCLDIAFPLSQNDSDDIDLEDFALPMLSDNNSSNPLLGSLVNTRGNDDEQIGAPVDIHPGVSHKRQKPLFISTAQVPDSKKVTPTDEETDITGGTNNGRSRTKGGKINLEDNPDGEERRVRIKIPVKYRIFSDNNNDNQTIYTLIIHSAQQVDGAFLTLTPIGESDDTNNFVHLQKTTCGIIEGNEISGVSLNKGKNIIHFSVDNQGEYAFSLLTEQEVITKE